MNLIVRIWRSFKYRIISRVYKPKVVKVDDRGIDNVVSFNGVYGNLKIMFRGNNNEIILGEGCRFLGTDNTIFVSGNDNKVAIGGRTTFDQRVLIVPGEGTSIEIGEDCMFASGVTIRSSDQHPIYSIDGKRLNPAKNIRIGNHVWLGAHVTVMKGLSIGDGTMVGYGSMVTRSLPKNCMPVGLPAKVIKENIHWDRYFK